MSTIISVVNYYLWILISIIESKLKLLWQSIFQTMKNETL